MYTYVDYKDIVGNKDWFYNHRQYKLCYVQMSPGKKLNRDDYNFSNYDDDFYHLDFYFTPISLDKQWGDDWDDAPYESNAGEPYDDYYTYDNEHVKIEIIVIDIPMPSHITGSINEIKEPRDYGYNSPFSVDMINKKAVAWLYIDDEEKGYASVLAGETPFQVIQKLSPWIQTSKEK